MIPILYPKFYPPSDMNFPGSTLKTTGATIELKQTKEGLGKQLPNCL